MSMRFSRRWSGVILGTGIMSLLMGLWDVTFCGVLRGKINLKHFNCLTVYHGYSSRLSSPEQSPFITHSSFFFRFLSYLLRIFSAVLRRLVLLSVVATAYATTTRFNTPLLEGAIVLDTENDLRECTASHPDVDLESVDGGYTINGPKGAILAYIGDHLSKEIDERMKTLELFENLLAEKGVSENDVFRVFEADRSGGNPFCVYPGVPGKCQHYTHCYVCSHGHRCI
ncbi:hypothetical protein BDV32DRAFT_129269 [Aspergillus pseudonomiae]|uniref:Uncharacterized protein n=1 Tax=Aspergillus pseudonomiae TaxID=1506151 RepID=A0A5N6HR78_9EURO|nr:uncharacterized protein BDV37DRAFT_253171 [Aspergillus pseudonomiae]KAB8256344.1 hypothetical protein BDV32DRAFT_129269 [Aspergillus pseudonomiae]KAE8402074.1 hypothetical protein BDV37DRAFT_253171 [Aspergillus pseudonomiae]